MKTSELIRLLKRHGCYLIEHDTNHDKWFSPITGVYFYVWRHKSKDIPTGTVMSILKDAGIKEK